MSYTKMQRNLENAILDLGILSGDILGPSDATTHDVRKTCAVNLRALANLIERDGAFTVYPSPFEAADKVQAAN